MDGGLHMEKEIYENKRSHSICEGDFMKIYIYRIWQCTWGILQTLLVHEYGHTIQSMILGPLYLIVIGIPSTLWGFLMGKKRKEK